ncbi:hypothetical protein L596_020190 [Steinernema carpocapsae]|uniref:Uncharacterized protein n=1 Tax=Steinernema carpocapsae TaxID=34508 RepID=A0A4U5MSW6_STECR|nr:hypothetical protein L596_020186 [Steinernema carpocapsae]TKR72788.1 hypothetical protein L596_020190 [Steinernema carpocapsae]
MVFQIPTHPSQQSHVAQLGVDVPKRCADSIDPERPLLFMLPPEVVSDIKNQSGVDMPRDLRRLNGTFGVFTQRKRKRIDVMIGWYTSAVVMFQGNNLNRELTFEDLHGAEINLELRTAKEIDVRNVKLALRGWCYRLSVHGLNLELSSGTSLFENKMKTLSDFMFLTKLEVCNSLDENPFLNTFIEKVLTVERQNRLSITVEDKHSNELEHLFKIALDAFKQDKIKYLKFLSFFERLVGSRRTPVPILTEQQQLEELILWFSKSAKYGCYELVVTKESKEVILNVFKRFTGERKPDDVNWPKFAENSNCGKRKDKTVFTAQLQNRNLEMILKSSFGGHYVVMKFKLTLASL